MHNATKCKHAQNAKNANATKCKHAQNAKNANATKCKHAQNCNAVVMQVNACECKKCKKRNAWAKTTRIFGQEPHLCPDTCPMLGSG